MIPGCSIDCERLVEFGTAVYAGAGGPTLDNWDQRLTKETCELLDDWYVSPKMERPAINAIEYTAVTSEPPSAKFPANREKYREFC